jgi:hypothetical protein
MLSVCDVVSTILFLLPHGILMMTLLESQQLLQGGHEKVNVVE